MKLFFFGILDGHIGIVGLIVCHAWVHYFDRKWQTRHGFCEATLSFWGVELSCLMSFWGCPSRMKIEDTSSKNVMLDLGAHVWDYLLARK